MSFNCFSFPGTNGQPLFDDGRTSCPAGFYCPNVTSTVAASSPRFCPPSPSCIIDRLTGKVCLPQGPLEPVPCTKGYYCPDGQRMLPCPKGYYCPIGSSEPTPCDPLGVCPEKSVNQQVFTGIIACLLIDIALALYFAVQYIRKLKRNNSWGFVVRTVSKKVSLTNLSKTMSLKNLNKVDPAIENESLIFKDEEKAVSPLVGPESLQPLVGSFKKALNGRLIQMDFKFENMGLKLDSGTVVLNGVNGTIRSAKMTAIMGPSGAGKTTFMNVLCGKVSRTSGKLWVNGKEAEVHQFKKLIGYVPQEDVMLRELTVKENILHAARVRLPRSWTDKEINDYVDDLIAALNLSHVKDTIIGDEIKRGVSGGQRKRVNIGIELAACPICIFLDEPTSGLDSTAALEVCKILKQITALGITVVAVVHQPRVEIFEAFDDVLMIAPGGRTAYLGAAAEAQSYFEKLGCQFHPKANPADVLMDILSGKAAANPESLVGQWKKHTIEDSQKPVEDDFYAVVYPLNTERGAPFWRQIIYCHNRSVQQQFRTVGSFMLECFVGFLAGSVMGISVSSMNALYVGMFIPPMTVLSPATFEWVVPVLSFITCMASGLAAAPAAVKVFSEEKSVYWRESSAGHSPLAYYIGKNLATIYRLIICSLHFAAALHVIGKPVIGFKNQWLIIFVTYIGVYGLSAVVSMLVARENAPLLAVVVSLFYSVFSGFGITLVNAWKWGILWLFDISYNRWAAEALYSECVLPFKYLYLVDESAKLWGYTLDRVGFCLGMAVLCGLYWRVIAYFLLILMHRDKQR
ncbi:hypothetical protein EDD86DRAFT_226334 [Gorgonomyces haynaldii]|nr:hypothetical protein EDD86DRAFT_226334 [Gorgonomyces haynaldii]